MGLMSQHITRSFYIVFSSVYTSDLLLGYTLSKDVDFVFTKVFLLHNREKYGIFFSQNKAETLFITSLLTENLSSLC